MTVLARFCYAEAEAGQRWVRVTKMTLKTNLAFTSICSHSVSSVPKYVHFCETWFTEYYVTPYLYWYLHLIEGGDVAMTLLCASLITRGT